MSLLFSLAVEHNWQIWIKNFKPAYLQAKRFNGEVFLQQLREEDDHTEMWELFVPSYGLIYSGWLWYITFHKVLTKRFGFEKSRLDLSMYPQKDFEEMLLLVVQPDDYLYWRTSNLVSAFKEFLHKQFYTGSREEPQLNIMCVLLDVDDCSGIGIDANRILDEIEPLVTGQLEINDKDRAAAEKKMTAYRSTIDELLYTDVWFAPA